jgi:hypothetical protein
VGCITSCRLASSACAPICIHRAPPLQFRLHFLPALCYALDRGLHAAGDCSVAARKAAVDPSGAIAALYLALEQSCRLRLLLATLLTHCACHVADACEDIAAGPVAHANSHPLAQPQMGCFLNKTSQTNLPADQPPQRQHCAGQERATSHSDACWQLRKRRALCNCSSAQRRVRGRVEQGCSCAAVNCLCTVHTREAAPGRLSCWETAGRPGDATPSHNLGATDDNICDLASICHPRGVHSGIHLSLVTCQQAHVDVTPACAAQASFKVWFMSDKHIYTLAA